MNKLLSFLKYGKGWFWKKYFGKPFGMYRNSRLFIASIRFGRWKASNHIAEIKDKIYLIPTIAFYFNSVEVYISFMWLNFKVWALYANLTKRRYV